MLLLELVGSPVYDLVMAVRPSQTWRATVEKEAAEVAAGNLSRDEMCAVDLWPESLLVGTDGALAQFERELRGVGGASDREILGVVQRAVLALNEINDDHDGAGYETDERYELCEYISACLAGAGADVGALAERHGLDPADIAGQWRDC